MSTGFDLDAPTPWPKPGDAAFVEDEDGHHNALLGWAGITGDWALYAQGFRRIADIAVERLEQDPVDLDIAVYPIAFLYRQYLELQLKQLWIDCKRLTGERAALPTHHQIDLLWQECRPTLDEFEPQSKADHDAAEAVILQFAEIDRHLFAFRYPVDKKGGRALPRDLKRLSLRKMRDAVAGVGLFLDAAMTQVSEALDWQRDLGS